MGDAMTPSTLVPGHRPVPSDYFASARANLHNLADVDAEIDRNRRFMAGAANEHRRAHFEARVKFLSKLRGEVATPELFAV